MVDPVHFWAPRSLSRLTFAVPLQVLPRFTSQTLLSQLSLPTCTCSIPSTVIGVLQRWKLQDTLWASPTSSCRAEGEGGIRGAGGEKGEGGGDEGVHGVLGLPSRPSKVADSASGRIGLKLDYYVSFAFHHWEETSGVTFRIAAFHVNLLAQLKEEKELVKPSTTEETDIQKLVKALKMRDERIP